MRTSHAAIRNATVASTLPSIKIPLLPLLLRLPLSSTLSTDLLLYLNPVAALAALKRCRVKAKNKAVGAQDFNDNNALTSPLSSCYQSATETRLQRRTYTGLRIASVFVILAGGSLGALFPVIAKRSPFFRVPKTVYEFAKYFGSGVIIATAFIHLLAPAFDSLGSDCLGDGWKTYPWAAAIAMMSMFALFLTELFAFRIGTAKLEALQVNYDPHGHDLAQAGHHSAHGPEGERSPTHQPPTKEKEIESSDAEAHDHARVQAFYNSTVAQIIGVSILEFGVIFHSVLIGLTLAVDEDFKVLFIVLVFHQTFEGLGLGSRLAYLDLPKAWTWARYVGAIAYGLTTPIGIAIGLGVRSTYNPGSTTASAVSGCLDAISAGILLYTGLVELLAHEFVFNPEAHKAPLGKLLYSIACMLLGAGLMSLLGRWA